jgi:hypothetical protein
MFCALRLIFGDTEGVGSHFHVLRSHTSFSAVLRASGPVFLFCALGLIFSGIVGRLVFMFCTPEHIFGETVFMFCAPRLVFGGIESDGSRLHVLRSRTRFGCSESTGSYFHILRSRTHFRRYRGRWVPFSCFALPNLFSAVLRASGHFFMFCVPELVFNGTAVVGSHFHVLRSWTHFRLYRGRRVQFSYFALADSFSTVPWV